MSAAVTVSQTSTVSGAIIGLVSAIFLGYLIFVEAKKINIQKFFTATSVLLILFAAGLVAHGVHEFQEAGIVPIVAEHVWDINPTVVTEGVYPLMHEKGYIGSILKGLFGYNGNPNLLEVVSYVAYITLIAFLWRRVEISKQAPPAPNATE